MEYVILFFVITIISIAITNLFQKRIEQVLPVTVILMILLVYISGIFDKLNIGIEFVKIVFLLSLLLVVSQFIQAIKKNELKSKLKNIITPGYLIYMIIYGVFIFLNKDRIFEDFDEFNHWAVIIKNMFLFDNYGVSANSIIEYQEYPPFMATFQYIFLQVKHIYAEDTAIIASNILYISMIIPVFSKIKWNKSLLWTLVLVPFVLLVPIMFYENFYSNILVDGMIGVLFACILYQIFHRKDNFTNIIMTLEIVSLGLLKPEGIGLSVCAIGILVISIMTQKEKEIDWKKEIFQLNIIFIIFIVFIGMWYGKGKLNQANQYWDGKNNQSQQTTNIEKARNDIERVYQDAFFKRTVTRGIKITSFSIMILLLVFNIICYYKINNSKRKKYKVISIGLWISNLLYIIALLYTYKFILPIEEALRLPSYERYTGTMLLANIIFHTIVCIEDFIENEKEKGKKIFIIVLCMIAIFPTIEIKDRLERLERDKNQAIENRKSYTKIQNYQEKLTQENKIGYINTQEDSYNEEFKYDRYLMLPIEVEKINVNLNEISRSQLIEILHKNKYTHIYIARYSNKFEEIFEQVFNCKIEKDTMYQITENNTLIKI